MIPRGAAEESELRLGLVAAGKELNNGTEFVSEQIFVMGHSLGGVGARHYADTFDKSQGAGAFAAGSVPNFHGCILPNVTSLPFCSSMLSIDARLEDLVGRLTLEEKIGLISPAHHTPSFSAGVPRLGIPPYNWLTEVLLCIQQLHRPCGGNCSTSSSAPLDKAVGSLITLKCCLLHDT